LAKILVFYKGDETVSSNLPHGKAKSDEMKQRPFVPTMTSLFCDMEKPGENPAKIYRKMSENMSRDIKIQAA